MRISLLSLALGLWASGSFACSPTERPLLWHDAPIAVASDGSFQNAGDIHFGDLIGGAIFDFGEQKVAQRVSAISVCGLSESLMFSDCRSREVVRVFGQYHDPYIGYMTPRTIDRIQVPIGAINVAEIENVEELVSIAYSNEYGVSMNVQEYVANMRPRNRFDPFNGCKIFYPDSYGATQ